MVQENFANKESCELINPIQCYMYMYNVHVQCLRVLLYGEVTSL